MAAVVGVAGTSWGFTAPAGPRKTSANAAAEMCFISLTFTGTYASAGDATVTSAVIAARIAADRRDGRTATILSLAPVAPGDEAGVLVFAQFATLSGSTWTMQLLQADNSTEHADGAMGTWNSGIIFAVGYTAV